MNFRIRVIFSLTLTLIGIPFIWLAYKHHLLTNNLITGLQLPTKEQDDSYTKIVQLDTKSSVVDSESDKRQLSIPIPQNLEEALQENSVTNLTQFQFPVPCIIINGPTRGIGNQLFKYSFGYALAQQLNAPLFLQFDHPKVKPSKQQQQRKFKSNERPFVLDKFRLDRTKFKYLPASIKIPKPEDDPRIWKVDEIQFWQNVIPNDKILVLNDFFISQHFFEPYKQQIQEQYEFNSTVNDFSTIQDILEQLETTESVGVHFRFGDFIPAGKKVKNSVPATLPITYQMSAMKRVQEILTFNNTIIPTNPVTFFIFTDDVKYVRNQLKSTNEWNEFNYIFISATKQLSSLEEFYLMRNCKHFIISNSTFSWWAAFLNKYKGNIIIAPWPRNRQQYYEKFNKNPELKKYKLLVNERKYSFPSEWITINPFDNEK